MFCSHIVDIIDGHVQRICIDVAATRFNRLDDSFPMVRGVRQTDVCTHVYTHLYTHVYTHAEAAAQVWTTLLRYGATRPHPRARILAMPTLSFCNKVKRVGPAARRLASSPTGLASL